KTDGRINLGLFVEPLRINRVREGRARAVDHHLRRSCCAYAEHDCESKKCASAEFHHIIKLPHPDSAGQKLYCYVCVTGSSPLGSEIIRNKPRQIDADHVPCMSSVEAVTAREA